MISFNCKFKYVRYHIKDYRGLTGYNPESRCDGYSFLLQDMRDYQIISNGNSTKYSKIINQKDDCKNDII